MASKRWAMQLYSGRFRYLLGGRRKPDLYLHIGMHKTGTTAIQAAMYASRNQLARRRIYYPAFEQNHSVAIGSLFSERPERILQNMRRGRTSPEQVAEFNADVARRLRRMCSREVWNKVLISGENISTLGSGGVGRMKRFFDDLVGSYSIIFYIRPPASFINSAAQERVKGGTILADLTAKPPLPQYRQRLEPFLETFGQASLDLRLYQRKVLDNGLLYDFCTALGEPGLSTEIVAGVRNRSWSVDAVHIMDAYNARYPLVVSNGDGAGSLNPDRPPDGVLRNVLQYLPGPTFSLAPEVLDSLLARCRDDIAWMEAVYGGRIGDPPERRESDSRRTDLTISSTMSARHVEEVVELLYGLCLHLRSEPGRARSYCDALLEHFGDNPELWFQRGVALRRQADPGSAEASLQKAIELDPDHFRAWNQIAVVRRARGDLTGARAAAEHCVGLSPETDAFRANLVSIRRQAWKQAPIKFLMRSRASARAESGNG